MICHACTFGILAYDPSRGFFSQEYGAYVFLFNTFTLAYKGRASGLPLDSSTFDPDSMQIPELAKRLVWKINTNNLTSIFTSLF
jgi:hypothetical protein